MNNEEWIYLGNEKSIRLEDFRYLMGKKDYDSIERFAKKLPREKVKMGEVM